MRNKLILILFLMILALIVIILGRSKQVFIKNIDNITIVKEANLEKNDSLINDLSSESTNKIDGVTPKFTVVEDRKEMQFCNKENNTYLITQANGYQIVAYQNENNFEYYRVKNEDCSLIGTVDDVNFTESTNETYANDSVYTVIDSLTNVELSGLVRISEKGVHSFDTIYKRYTSPVSFDNGVITIENYNSIVAFDNENKVIFSQKEKADRRVISINRVDRSLFVLVSENGKLFLEGYKIDDVDSIKQTLPVHKFEVPNDFFNKTLEGVDVVTRNSNYFGSFTANGKTMIVSSDFGRLFLLSNADTSLGLNNNLIFLKSEDNYFVVNLDSLQFENFGVIKATSLKIINNYLYFIVLDDNKQELYIKFSVK